MAKKGLTPEQVLTLLTETAQRIGTLIKEASPAHLQTPIADGEWSATEILAHLRSCADVWGNCITRILGEEQPTIKAINPTTWILSTDYPQLDFAESWTAFMKQRAALLAQLKPLPPEAWLRDATITGAGTPLKRSVLFYGTWLATHERSHIKQFQQIAKATSQGKAKK